jgi:hypothetical protein
MNYDLLLDVIEKLQSAISTLKNNKAAIFAKVDLDSQWAENAPDRELLEYKTRLLCELIDTCGFALRVNRQESRYDNPPLSITVYKPGTWRFVHTCLPLKVED